MPTNEQFLDAARRSAPAFGLSPDDVSMLSHSENVVCDLAVGRVHYAMRLHRPGYNTVAEMESEVVWGKALSDAGIPVPVAVPTTSGGYYTAIEVADEVRQVGVIEWVDGASLGGPLNSSADVVPHYVTTGELAARIHQHSAVWKAPAGFERQSWDADGLVGPNPLWGRFWEVEQLTQAQRQVFSAARDALHVELSALPVDTEHFGLIHADLHLGNLMVDGEALTIIDFDDSGFGWFMYDLAVALHPAFGEPWEADATAALIEGYRKVRPLSANDEQLINTFLVVRSLMIVAWLNARPELPVYKFLPDLVKSGNETASRYLTRRGL